MSKIKKNKRSKKKRNEKGKREALAGSNPHSKGLDFSRLNKYSFNPCQ